MTAAQLATEIAAALNDNATLTGEWIYAKAWTKVAGKERVYFAQWKSSARKASKDLGWIDVATLSVEARLPRRCQWSVEEILATFTVPTKEETEHVGAKLERVAESARDGTAYVTHSADELLEAVNAGYVSMSDAMNQDF